MEITIVNKNDAAVPVNVPVNLTETQRKILELITQNAIITHSEMAKVLFITERTARRTTNALREMGLLDSNCNAIYIHYQCAVSNLQQVVEDLESIDNSCETCQIRMCHKVWQIWRIIFLVPLLIQKKFLCVHIFFQPPAFAVTCSNCCVIAITNDIDFSPVLYSYPL